MRFYNPHSVRFKIVFYTLLCLSAIGLCSNLFLYSYMNSIITDKAGAIDTLYLETIRLQLDTRLAEVNDLAILCASDPDLSRVMEREALTAPSEKHLALTVQEQLNAYLRSCAQSDYINKLMAVNEYGVTIQMTTKHSGTLRDCETLLESDFYRNNPTAQSAFSMLVPSVTPYKGMCLAGLFPLASRSDRPVKAYIYVELDPSFILDVLEPYAALNPIFVGTANGEKLLNENLGSLRELDLTGAVTGSIVFDGSVRRKVETEPLRRAALTIYSCPDISTISVDDKNMLFTMAVTLCSVFLVGLCSLLILSNYLTRPIHKLIKRIRRISDNDFSYDPEIERSRDEIGEIGHVVNEMTLSLQSLLQETAERAEAQKNIEIALLQSQVNPHFLYNTLDSIHWMAVIQKSTGISQMTKSLSNLLKNLAKGTQDHITLQEELSLLNDYVAIQMIRYTEAFEVIDRIPQPLLQHRILKFTLQPLVENAIFHGIEPTGRFGAITLDGWEDEQFLYLSICDNGVGIPPEQLHTLLSASAEHRSKGSLNGIGVFNVDQRLKLVYGPACGLTYESVVDEYTKVTVKILREVEPDV